MAIGHSKGGNNPQGSYMAQKGEKVHRAVIWHSKGTSPQGSNMAQQGEIRGGMVQRLNAAEV